MQLYVSFRDPIYIPYHLKHGASADATTREEDLEVRQTKFSVLSPPKSKFTAAAAGIHFLSHTFSFKKVWARRPAPPREGDERKRRSEQRAARFTWWPNGIMLHLTSRYHEFYLF